VTFGVIDNEEPFLAEVIALAVESAGHDCLVLKDLDHAASILRAIHLDAIVLNFRMPGRNGLDWLEVMVTTWPDLPARTLLLTNSALTADEEARITCLGAEVVVGPLGLAGVERVVTRRLEKAHSERTDRPLRGLRPATRFRYVN
jgi:DNA-binding response OmpR family regulator